MVTFNTEHTLERICGPKGNYQYRDTVTGRLVSNRLAEPIWQMQQSNATVIHEEAVVGPIAADKMADENPEAIPVTDDEDEPDDYAPTAIDMEVEETLTWQGHVALWGCLLFVVAVFALLGYLAVKAIF